MSQGYARTSPWRSSAQSAIWRTKGRYDRCNGVRMSCPRTGRPLNDPKHRNQSFRTIHFKNYLRIEQPFLTSVAVVVFNQKKSSKGVSQMEDGQKRFAEDLVLGIKIHYFY